MNGYRRPCVGTLLTRLRDEPRSLTVVAGPRLTGKTTLIKQVLDQVERPWAHVAVDEPDPITVSGPLSVDADPPTSDVAPPTDRRDARWLARTWELARVASEDSNRGFVLALDEIQKIPNWFETVKDLWDSDRCHRRQIHIALLGPAPLPMQKGAGDGLADPFEVIDVGHWSFAEMNEAFGLDVDQYIYFGGYPGAASLIRDEVRWRSFIAQSIVAPYVGRDILALQRVERPGLLRQLFSLASEYSGQVLSYNKILGQLQDSGNKETLVRYLKLLSTAKLITGIPQYANSPHRRRGSIPKLNVLNTAFMAAHSGYTFAQARADRAFWGRLAKSAVGAHLVNTADGSCRVHYWRENGSEVDFVLERGRRLVAFAVKSGRRRSARGLEAFGERFSVTASHIVGMDGLPMSEFLLKPAREWFE